MYSPVAASPSPRFAIRAGRTARSCSVSATAGDAVTSTFDTAGNLASEPLVSGSLRGVGGHLAVDFTGSGACYPLADSRPTDGRETDEHEVIARRVETGRMIVSINNGNTTEPRRGIGAGADDPAGSPEGPEPRAGGAGPYLNSSGTVVAWYVYNVWGNLSGSGGGSAGLFNFRFSTKYPDTNTAFYYYGYRYYNPYIARWLNRDPIGENGGLNLYGFVGNDGVNRLDSLGLSPGPWPGVRPGGTPCADCHPPKFPEVDNLYSILGDPPPPPGYPLPSIGKRSEGGWGGAIRDLVDWLTGSAPDITDYGPGTPESGDMKNSPIGDKLREGYLSKFKDKKCAEWGNYTNVKLSFGASEFIRSLPNGTAHFVGSGRGDAYTKEVDEKNCRVKSEFTITNTTSLKSAFYHLIPNSWNNTATGTPAANWTQTYTWNEEFDCKK